MNILVINILLMIYAFNTEEAEEDDIAFFQCGDICDSLRLKLNCFSVGCCNKHVTNIDLRGVDNANFVPENSERRQKRSMYPTLNRAAQMVMELKKHNSS